MGTRHSPRPQRPRPHPDAPERHETESEEENADCNSEETPHREPFPQRFSITREPSIRRGRLAHAPGRKPKAARPTFPPVRSNPTHEKEHEEDDQNDAEDTDAAVTVAIAVAAESATEAQAGR